MQTVKEIPLEKVLVGVHEQRIRGEDPDLEELVASIRRIGIIVPLVVRQDGEYFVVVAGHRRYAAAKKCGLTVLPCSVRNDVGSVSAEVSFAENMFRKDLSPLELACAIDDCIQNETMTVKEMAIGLHRSEVWVTRMRNLLKWPSDVLEAIHGDGLAVSAAHNLALITDDKYRQYLIKNAMESGATARTTAAWLQAWRAMEPAEMAIMAEPVNEGKRVTPMVPQAPCIACGEVYRTDQLSHVPVCCGCIQAIREAGR